MNVVTWWKADIENGSVVAFEGNEAVLIYGIIMTVPCLSLALWPHKRAQAIEARVKEGDDAFFEEQRTYHSYPWLSDPKRLRIAGIIGTVCGLLFCGIEIYRP